MVPSEKLSNAPAKEPIASRQNATTSLSAPPVASKFAQATHAILALQRSIGNRRVAALLRKGRITPQGNILPVQAKLTVGAANDPEEKEAEDVSRQIIGMDDASVRASSEHASPQEDRGERSIHGTFVAHAGNAVATSLEEEDREEDKDDEGIGKNRVDDLRRQATTGPSLESFEAEPAVEARIDSSKG